MTTLNNRTARRVFIERHGLAETPTPKLTRDGLYDMIDRLGFVQVDSIQYVERAHHMILFSRNQTYRKKDLSHLVERDRRLFENWTHDASIIPSRFFPYWQAAVPERTEYLHKHWTNWGRNGFREQAEDVLAEIARRGPCLTREMGEGEERSSGGWWEWNPSKSALEYLWRTGRLCISRREGFQKVYDLTENVIPEEHRCEPPARSDLIDWACNAALDRLGFATTGEMAAFWKLISPAEAKDWAAARDDLTEVVVDGEGGPRKCLAREGTNWAAPEPPARIRALSPFDPMIRDRKRTKRLFGFDYTIEVFVPAAKRKYGYYVFPLMEGDRLIGRIDMKADRNEDCLRVSGLWLEPKIKFAKGRRERLEAELERQRRFAGVARVEYQDGWIRT